MMNLLTAQYIPFASKSKRTTAHVLPANTMEAKVAGEVDMAGSS
jgi:hypothetical protein